MTTTCKDDTIYDRVNEAFAFASQGYAPAWIAAKLFIPEAEAWEILEGPEEYQRRRGIQYVKAPQPVNIPSGCEIRQRRAEVDAIRLAALRGRVPHGRSEREPRTVKALPKQVVGPNTV